MANLLETLRQAQRFGFFGDGDVARFAEHSQRFVDALEEVPSGAALVDLGAGGGLPGLVIADARPDLEIVLADRRQKRTDFLELAVIRHGWHHVHVECIDVVEMIDDGRHFEAVTARGFGPPEFFLECVAGLLSSNGLAVISEPPTGERWPPELVAGYGLESWPRPGVRCFGRRRQRGADA